MAYAYRTSSSVGGTGPQAMSITYVAGDRGYVKTTSGAGGGTETISDGTNTYSFLETEADVSGDNQNLYECINPTPGTYTLQQGLSGGAGITFCDIEWAAYTGLTGSSLATAQYQGAPGTGTNAVTSGDVTPSSQPGALITFGYDFDTYSTGLVVSAGFTQRDTFATAALANGNSAMLADKRLTTTTPAAGTFTATVATDPFITFAIWCAETAAGGGTFIDDDSVVSF